MGASDNTEELLKNNNNQPMDRKVQTNEPKTETFVKKQSVTITLKHCKQSNLVKREGSQTQHNILKAQPKPLQGKSQVVKEG